MGLVRLPHHDMLLLFLNMVVRSLLVILLVTDIPVRVVRLLEVSWVALVLGGLGVAAPADVRVLDRDLARVNDGHAVTGRALSHVILVPNTALGLDLKISLL
jgi:hypothetical protein